MVSSHLEKSLRRAFQLAEAYNHEMVTLEHLLLALLEDEDALMVINGCGAKLDDLKQDITDYIEESFSNITSFKLIEPTPSLAFQRVIQRAALHIQSNPSKALTGDILLIAFFSEKESNAVYFLEKQNLTRLDIANYLTQKGTTVKPSPSENFSQKTNEADNSYLAKYCTHLNSKAMAGQIDPLVGRTEEIERITHILGRRTKNNPLLIGDPGVGKTALVEGLALQIIQKKTPKFLQDADIYSLNLGALVAGTRFRGDFEERLQMIVEALKNKPHALLFIDEIHNIVGAGSTGAGTMDASNLLKPLLVDQSLRCIGSTTYQEFRKLFEQDPALSRRFQKLDIQEPSTEEALKIIQGLKSSFEAYHDVSYKPEALKAAVGLSHRHLSDRRLPDKVVDVIDEAGAAIKLKEGSSKVVQLKDVEDVIARMAKVPRETLSRNERQQLKNLHTQLIKTIFGQDHAIEKVTDAIKLSRSGLRDTQRPIGSFLFAGPTGVGKTELARQLAEHQGLKLLRFDMSEYMEKHSVSRLIGTPPGYVGFEQGGLLTDAIDQSPHAILLLDEIEKAHADIYNLLLQVMDYGKITDHNGKTIDCSHLILIMTTNAGAAQLSKAPLGFGKNDRSNEDDDAIFELFSPEFRGRLDGVIKFNHLTEAAIIAVVNKFLDELKLRLEKKNVKITFDKKALTWLCNNGIDSSYGARPLKTLIENHISKPLAHEILFGPLTKGGSITVSTRKDCLQLKVHK